MNYRVEFTKIQKLLNEFIPVLKDTILRQQVESANIIAILKETKIIAILKETKKINYRIDRLRNDLKLAKENKEKIDVSNSSGIDNGCAEPDKRKN